MDDFKKFSALSETGPITSNSVSPNCVGGHSFVCSASHGGHVPEGYSCLCGQTRMHYEKCECCGFTNGRAVLRAEYESLPK